MQPSGLGGNHVRVHLAVWPGFSDPVQVCCLPHTHHSRRCHSLPVQPCAGLPWQNQVLLRALCLHRRWSGGSAVDWPHSALVSGRFLDFALTGSPCCNACSVTANSKLDRQQCAHIPDHTAIWTAAQHGFKQQPALPKSHSSCKFVC